MRIFSLSLAGIENNTKPPLAYVSDPYIALKSIKLTFGHYDGFKVKEDLNSMTVFRAGFDPIRFVLEPIELMLHEEQL